MSANNLLNTPLILILITTLIIVLGSLYFWLKMRKLKPESTPRGFVLLVQTVILSVEKIVISLLGRRYAKITPYIIYLFLYINLTNFLSIIIPPFTTPLNYLYIILTLGSVTLLGMIVFGFLYKGRKFIFTLLNPFEWVSMLTSFVSISFRLFGNILAGFLLLSLLYTFFVTSSVLPTEVKYFNIFAILIAPFHLYFDFFSGFLHSMVFIFLTLTYWSLNRPESLSQFDSKSPENKEITINSS